MGLEERLAALLEKVLSGEMVEGQVDRWYVYSWFGLKAANNCHRIRMEKDVGREESKAEFKFMSVRWDSYVSFENYHRLCPKGTGTPSLKEIEAAFQALANQRNQMVRSEFRVLQEDVVKWLIKNGYRLEKRVYMKDFYPATEST